MPYFISNIEDRVLAYRGWLPFTLDNVRNYRLAYLHQSWAVTIAASVNGATEVLVSGFMIQICSQFKILEKRFVQLPNTIKDMRSMDYSENEIVVKEKKMIVALVRHHLRIFE